MNELQNDLTENMEPEVQENPQEELVGFDTNEHVRPAGMVGPTATAVPVPDPDEVTRKAYMQQQAMQQNPNVYAAPQPAPQQNPNVYVAPQPATQQPYMTDPNMKVKSDAPEFPVVLLVFGILSIALSEGGPVGLIFAIISLVKQKKYADQYGNVPSGTRTAAKVTSIIGCVTSGIGTAIWLIYLLVFIILFSLLAG